MKKLLLLVFAALTIHTLQAQLKDLPILNDTLYSAVLKEKRPLEIVMPTPSAQENTKYDVLYVTDGEWNTKIVRDIHQFLEIQFLPPCIIVSIPNLYVDGNNLRGRDYSPTHTDWPGSGGADNYLSFLKNELIPYINKKYATSGTNILYGSSLAGLFGLYAFIKEPQLFESYMLSDPAFWWDNNYMRKLLSDKLESTKTLDKSLFIAGRTGDAYRYMGIGMIDSVLREKKPEGLRWKTKLYDDETHNSMMFMTVYAGLKHTYYGYSKETLNFYPANGIITEGKPVKFYSRHELFQDKGYTMDGTEPGPSSPRVNDKGEFIISSPGTLTLKAFCNVERYSKKATGTFKAGVAPPPVARLKKAKAGGWHYSYYEGSWNTLPDFKKLKPVQSGFADKDFTFAKLPRQKNFACVQEGQIEIKDDGYHVFGLDCDGGARMFIANQLIIDYDGQHTTNNYQTYVLPLKKGFYPVRLEYFEKEGNALLNLMYITPASEDAQAIASEVRYGY